MGGYSIKYAKNDLIDKFIFITEIQNKWYRQAKVKCIKCGKERISNLSHLKCGRIKCCSSKIGIVASDTKEYYTWSAIKSRCYNKNTIEYKNYGGRGITMCDRWRYSFSNFFYDMGKRPSNRHSIDRLDNNKGYSPDNCSWRTVEEQHRNKRVNVFITMNGETKCITDWSRLYGIYSQVIKYRIKSGWNITDAITKPPHHV